MKNLIHSLGENKSASTISVSKFSHLQFVNFILIALLVYLILIFQLTHVAAQTLCPPSNCTPGRNVGRDFFNLVIEQLPDVPLSDFAVEALIIWEPHENTLACWNPLATTMKIPGSCYFNCIKRDSNGNCIAGVQHYLNQDMGVQAIANTLSLSYYEAIRKMLRIEAFDREGLRASLSTWGTCRGEKCNTLLDRWQTLWDSQNQSGGSTATVLTMDVSGSMGENWQGGVKIESAKSAAYEIVNMIEQESQVGGVSHRLGLSVFTTDASLMQGLSTDYTLARTTIASLVPLNNTNIGAGLTVANQALLQATPGEAKIIILLSDGMSNTGLTPDEIISGPVQEAANAGTCIYTVGFGDQGNLDEELLRRIAAGSGCGEYFYAPDVNELEKVYIRIRHVTTGDVLAEFNGIINQGQTVHAGTFDVPIGQEELAVSLHWPGSALDLQLVDPNRRMIDQNYQGANIATYSNLVYALIEKPINGNWELSVYGREVPEGSAPYDAIISSRVGVITMPVTTSFGPGILVVLIVLASGGVGAYALVHRRKLTKLNLQSSIPETSEASLRAISGPIVGKTTTLPITGLSIGRSRACNLQIQDFTISRQHARLRYAQDNWFIQDVGSKGGTFVNGQKISASILKSGDHIKIGSSEFEFRV